MPPYRPRPTTPRAAPPRAALVALAALAAALVACRDVAPLPPATSLAPAAQAQAELGQRLFYDARLSRDGTVACASCHDVARGGADPAGEATSRGVGGARTRRNTPTVLNAAPAPSFFWDGRAATLEAQALGPLFSPAEMGSDEATLVATLAALPEYASRFRAAWPDDAAPVTAAHAAAAIAAYERRLRAPARFDAFLAGDDAALSPAEQRGLAAFRARRCARCHDGPLVGGAQLERLGEAEPWPDARDLGRFEVTRAEADRMVFRVPVLRNVARTAPYFHDGSVETLEQAVDAMARYQLGVTLPDAERADIVAFLGALTGDADAALAAPPSP